MLFVFFKLYNFLFVIIFDMVVLRVVELVDYMFNWDIFVLFKYENNL